MSCILVGLTNNFESNMVECVCIARPCLEASKNGFCITAQPVWLQKTMFTYAQYCSCNALADDA